jgi:hypothetical protein
LKKRLGFARHPKLEVSSIVIIRFIAIFMINLLHFFVENAFYFFIMKKAKAAFINFPAIIVIDKLFLPITNGNLIAFI